MKKLTLKKTNKAAKLLLPCPPLQSQLPPAQSLHPLPELLKPPTKTPSTSLLLGSDVLAGLLHSLEQSCLHWQSSMRMRNRNRRA